MKFYYFRKLINNLRFIVHILLVALFYPAIIKADGEPKKDTTRLKISAAANSSENSAVTKAQLVHLVDSLFRFRNN